MNIMSFKRQSSLLGLAVLGVVCSALSAGAQTTNSVDANATSSTAAQTSVAVTSTQVDPVSPSVLETAVVEPLAAEPSVPPTSAVTAQASPEVQSTTSAQATSPAPAPVGTSASALGAPTEVQQAAPAQQKVAQFDGVNVDPGQATISSPSYIGVGGSFGIDEGEGFTVLSKVGLSSRFSVRPSAVTDFNDQATIRIPLTLDFAPQQRLGRFSLAPYIGAGVAFGVGEDSDVGPTVTAGLDVPLTPRFTGTAGLNVDFVDDANVGVFFGVGYNFPGLFQR